MRTIKKRLPVGGEGGIVRIRKSLKGDQVNFIETQLKSSDPPSPPCWRKKNEQFLGIPYFVASFRATFDFPC